MPFKLKELKMEENTHGHMNDVVVNQEAAEPQEESNEFKDLEQPQDSEFDRKFAALSRKEKALRERELELERKFGSKEKELPLERRIRSNPLKALEELGLDYDKLTELALNDGRLTPDMQMKLMREELENDYKEKFNSLEERLNAKEKMEEEAKYDAVKQGFVGEIESFINENKNDFEYVAHNEATDVVYDVIEEHYNETGRILDIKEAVEAVESYLEEEAEKLLNLGKVKNRLNSIRDEYEQPQRQSQVTLSNAHSAQANERVGRKLSDEESKREMARMLQWDE
jgi:hypothetical protein|tara:strand:- start:410 stop:1264 length:855 start_codon:yes stop_codon:yes gene_type:complete